MAQRQHRRIIAWSRLSEEARRRWRRLALRCLLPLVAAAATAALIPACADFGQVEGVREQAVDIRSRLEAQAADLEQRLAATSASDPARAEIETQLAGSRTALHAVTQGVGELDRAVAAADAPPSPGDVAGSVAAFLPEPWRTSVVLGGTALAFLWRARQLKVGLRSVAKGIEVAKKQDEEFRKRFAEHATTFRSVQTSTAQKVVDEITSPGKISLPI